MKKVPVYLEVREPPTLRWRILGILIVVVCLAFTFGMWTFMERTNDSLAAVNFDVQADRAIDVLEERLEVYGDLLYGGRGLFLQDPELTRVEWDTFMESQNLFERYPGINNIAYLEVATPADASRIERELNQSAQLGDQLPISLYPQPLTDRLAVVTYSTTVTDDYQVLGLNAYGREALVPALELAAISGLPESTEAFKSRNPAREGTKDVIIFLAVYEKEISATSTDAERIDALSGYIALSIHPETLIKQGLNEISSTEPVSVRVETVNGDRIYSSPEDIPGVRIEKNISLDVSGQTWRFTFTAPDYYGLTLRERFAPGFMLIVGLIIMIGFMTSHLYAGGVRVRKRGS